MWKNKWQRVILPLSLPTKPDISFHPSLLLVLTSGLYKFKAQFSISEILKVTVCDKSYSPGCQIKLTWAMEGEQKNKEDGFDSLVFAKWDKINPSEGEAPALTGKPARVVTGNVTEIQEFCWLASQGLSGLFVEPSTQVFLQRHQVEPSPVINSLVGHKD